MTQAGQALEPEGAYRLIASNMRLICIRDMTTLSGNK
jgi:hypothetical protein